MSASTKRNAALYRKAAQILEFGECRDVYHAACTALADAAHPEKSNREGYSLIVRTPLVRDFQATFKPENGYGYWGRLWSDASEEDSQAKSCRILALCFMAAMVEAGDICFADSKEKV